MQMLIYRFAKKNIHKYKNKMVSYVATYEYEKGPRLDF